MKLSAAAYFLLMLGATVHAGTLRINGSTTVNLPVAEAAEILRKENGMDIQVDTQGGSAGGISMLAAGQIDVGMSSKPVIDEDRKRFPDCRFHETMIGEDAVAIIVSKDVWDGGVKALSKDDLKGIYEGRIRNWKDVGGPDRRIAFFNKEPGRGTWEVFTHWLYGSSKNAPAVSFPEVGGNEETRNKVSATKGAMSQLSASWVDNRTVFAVGLKTEKGAVTPEPQNIATGDYPMSRPLFLLTNGEPSGDAKTLVQVLLSERGQKLVEKHGYLGLARLKRS